MSAGALHVKICGVTSVRDAEACVESGADAVGLNFWPGSPRRCDEATAREVVCAVGSAVRVVGVFVDAGVAEIARVRRATGLSWVQLHGDETPGELAALQPDAFKALRVAGPDAVASSSAWPGELLLLDASVPGAVGGTGRTFDWSIAEAIARSRKILLAGGLGPGNVAAAVRQVAPFGVDVASGVESAPGIKDRALVQAFVDAARG